MRHEPSSDDQHHHSVDLDGLRGPPLETRTRMLQSVGGNWFLYFIWGLCMVIAAAIGAALV